MGQEADALLRGWRQNIDLTPRPLLRDGQIGYESASSKEWARLDSNQGPRDYEKTGLSKPTWPSMTYTCH
jgi:hypothetical protein